MAKKVFPDSRLSSLTASCLGAGRLAELLNFEVDDAEITAGGSSIITTCTDASFALKKTKLLVT